MLRLLNKKGFLSIEMLLVIVTLASFSSISIFQLNKIEQSLISNKEVELLQSMINNARTLAMNTRVNTEINFSQNYFSINNDKVNQYKFSTIYFTNSKSLYYNAKGNINHGYTIQFNHLGNPRKIVFYLGKGWFKIE